MIEPAALAKQAGWAYQSGTAGFGSLERVRAAIEAALADPPWLLGEWFTMADVMFGATVRFMVRFSMLEATPAIGRYLAALAERPAFQAAARVNGEGPA